MEWVKITPETELLKEQAVFLADKIDVSFAIYSVGERPFDAGPREVYIDGGGLESIDNYTHYCITTLPED